MTSPDPNGFAVDIAMVRGALAGDPESIERLGDRLSCIGRILRAQARKLCGGLPDQDLLDLGQSVAEKVIARLGDYVGRASLESWVFAFCAGELRNELRRRSRRQARAAATDPDSLPTEHAELRDFTDLHRCLARLANEDQSLVRAKHYEGLRLEDLAVRFRAGLNTIKSRYYRALLQLRQCLQQSGLEGA